MNARQYARLSMYVVVESFCRTKEATAKKVPVFARASNELTCKLEALHGLLKQEIISSKGITAEKTKARKSLATKASLVAAIMYSHADETGNGILKANMDWSYTDLYRSNGSQLAVRCQNILHDTLQFKELLPYYGLSVEQLEDLQAAINDFNSKEQNPRMAIAGKKVVRADIAELMKEIDHLLKKKMDKTILAFKSTDPGFVKEYGFNRSIIDAPRRASKLKLKAKKEHDQSTITSNILYLASFNKKPLKTPAAAAAASAG